MTSIWTSLTFCCLMKSLSLSKRDIVNTKYEPFNLLPNDKILDQSKLKATADNTLKVIQIARFVLEKIENIVEKEENAGYQHFLLFPQCFQKSLSLGLLKSGLCSKQSNETF